MKEVFSYKKLPGVRRGLIRKAALWDGSDHLLSVTGTRFFEQYRRFYYRDIQALIVRKCPHPGSIGVWLLTAFFCGLFAFLGNIFSRVNGVSKSLHFVFWTISAACFLYLVYRLIVSLKYSCRCYIQTAVTREELPSLYRVWSTQKALTRIRAKISEAQGALMEEPQLLAEEIVDQDTKEQWSLSAAGSDIRGGADESEGERTAVIGMNLALGGCIALLVLAALLFWYMDAPALYSRHPGVLLANASMTSIAGIGFLLSLLRIYKIRALYVLRNFLFAALALIGLHVYFSTLFSRIYPQGDPVSLALSSAAFRHWFSLIDGSFALLCGLSGVALIVSNWDSYHKGAISNA